MPFESFGLGRSRHVFTVAPQVYRYCQRVNGMMSSPDCRGKKVYHVSSMHPHRRVNSVFLVSSFAVICLRKSPEDALAPFLSA